MITEAVVNQNPTPQEAPKTEERIAPKLQVLVQREKQALERERVAKQKEAEFETKMKAFSERESKLSEFESLKSTNPMKALELMGLSYQDLTSVALNDGQVTPEIQVKKVEEKLDSYLKAQEAAELQKAEDLKREAVRREEDVTKSFKSDITSYLDSDPTKYELIRFEGLQDFVYDIIDEHYNRTIDPVTGVGKILTIQEASDKLETQLEKRDEERRKLSKLNQKQVPPLIENVAKQQTFTPRQQPKTLTNQLSQTPTQPRTKALTDEERVQKAIAYARSIRPNL